LSHPTNRSLHTYLTGSGLDGRGRQVVEVLTFSNDQLEEVHDYIQWLFPLPTRSAAQPTAPVLDATEIEAIRANPRALATLKQAADRMLQFYRETGWWLRLQDHNHLRIARIIQSLRVLVGPTAAHEFHRQILALHDAAGASVNPLSLRFWM
jgi:hypothetical protein